MRIDFRKFFFIALLVLVCHVSYAQYFGQNKVRYKRMNFQVYQTPHFEIYYYLKNDSLIRRLASESEVWYQLHSQKFGFNLKQRNPLVLYENHPDFQQTTAIDGDIGVGTGGVTEAAKNRVVMPIMEFHHQTRHVLGHELVHAFQYRTLIDNDSLSLQNIRNLPLWMVEGMAEYLSIGKVDAYTAMWMRDAVISKDIPTLKELSTSGKYFPYRYGQAFWAFIASNYQDSMVVHLFKKTAMYGLDKALKRVFRIDEKKMSELWKRSIIASYKPLMKDSIETPIGRKLITDKNGGRMNVAPSISPDGTKLVFMSERDLFSIDLFLADAQTGKIIRKLSSKTSSSHIDEFNFLESAGTWSPDGKLFAFSIFSKGRNKLMIVDASTGATIRTESIGNIEQFSNLSWSPNGHDIALTGMVNGQTDIYLYNITTQKITQLTNDVYSDSQPAFSPDGSMIAFSTDRLSFVTSNSSLNLPISIALIDLTTHETRVLPIFEGANNLNPQFSPDGQYLYFLSNRDGYRNLYRASIDNTPQIEQLTDYFTGICGVTEYSPALSVSRSHKVVYSYYREQKYTLYIANENDFQPVSVKIDALNFTAATLTPIDSMVVNNLAKERIAGFKTGQLIGQDSIRTIRYKPKFKMDYLTSSGMGAGVSRFGVGLASGVQAVFSDILGTNKIYALAAINGQIYDFGAQVAYVNQERRFDWGGGLSHIPYQLWNRKSVETTYNGASVTNIRLDLIRIFEDQASFLVSHPFSRAHRVDFSTALSYYSYMIQSYNNYYDVNGNLVATSQSKMTVNQAKEEYADSRLNFNSYLANQIGVHFVGDNSYAGVTATPLSGFRYRIGAEQMLGGYQITSFIVDLRRYVRLKPFTFATRLYTYQRYGKDSNRLYPLYLGYPYFVRGYYDYSSLYQSTSQSTLNNLTGSKLALANFEIRIPFTGPKKLSLIPSKMFYSDLAFFVDTGLAWYNMSDIALKYSIPQNSSISDNYRIPVTSYGVSLRVNVFGAMILEPYYARSLQLSGSPWLFGINFLPGW